MSGEKLYLYFSLNQETNGLCEFSYGSWCHHACASGAHKKEECYNLKPIFPNLIHFSLKNVSEQKKKTFVFKIFTLACMVNPRQFFYYILILKKILHTATHMHTQLQQNKKIWSYDSFFFLSLFF